MTEVKLPSGATLKITISPFAVSKALYQELLKELKDMKLGAQMEMAEAYKNLLCAGYSSPAIEKRVWDCFERCTYNSGNGDLRITPDTFEPVDARQDYMMACLEVAKENILPFVKSLYAEFERMLATTPKSPT